MLANIRAIYYMSLPFLFVFHLPNQAAVSRRQQKYIGREANPMQLYRLRVKERDPKILKILRTSELMIGPLREEVVEVGNGIDVLFEEADATKVTRGH